MSILVINLIKFNLINPKKTPFVDQNNINMQLHQLFPHF